MGSRGPRIPLLTADAAMCTGGLMLVGIDSETSLPWLLASYVVIGLGFGLVNASITNTALSGIPRSQAGAPRRLRPRAARSVRHWASRWSARY